MTLPIMPRTPVSEKDTGVAVFAQSAKLRFPPQARVRAKAEFSRVFDAGKRTADPRFALHWLQDAAPPRLGLAVSRKVDLRAVGRNRIKRLLRDTFRQLRPQLQGGAYVVVARPSAKITDNAALRCAFEHLLKRAGALPPTPPNGTMPPAVSHSSLEAGVPMNDASERAVQ